MPKKTAPSVNGEKVGHTDMTYSKVTDVELGMVVVEDKDDGEEVVIYKAMSGDTVRRSDSPVDAVMGVIEAETGGVV